MLTLHLALLTSAIAADLPSIDEPLKTGNRATGDAAVVIGIEDYFRLPEVPHAKRDASAVYDFLVYTRGVPSDRVHLLDTDATREAMLSAVEEAAGAAGQGGRVWVYYAGHGAAASDDGGRIWLGADTLPTVASFDGRGLRVSDVKQRIADTGAHALIIADACYTGADRGGATLVPGARFAVPSYAAQPEPHVVEWNAVSASEVALPLDPVRHGAFTYLMLGALRGWADGELDGQTDGRVTAEEASLYVRSSLRALQLDGQTPNMSVDDGAELVLVEGKLERGPAWTAEGASPTPTAAQTPSAPQPAVPTPRGSASVTSASVEKVSTAARAPATSSLPGSSEHASSPAHSPSPSATLSGARQLSSAGVPLGATAAERATSIPGYVGVHHYLGRGFGRPMDKRVGPCKKYGKMHDPELFTYAHGNPADEPYSWWCVDQPTNVGQVRVWRGDDTQWQAFADDHVALGATLEPWQFGDGLTLLTTVPAREGEHPIYYVRADAYVYEWHCSKIACAEVVSTFVALTHEG